MQGNRNVQYYDDNTVSIYDIWLAIKKRRWLICIIALLSFVVSLGYSFVTPNVYKISNVLILSHGMNLLGQEREFSSSADKSLFNVSEIKSAITVLQTLSKRQQMNKLALEESISKVIKDIKVSEIEEKELLELEVNTLDSEAGVRVINAITKYVNNLPFVLKRIEQRKQLLKKNIEELRRIIADPWSYSNLPDNATISEILISLYKLRKNYNEISLNIDELEKGKVMALAGETLAPEKPYRPKRTWITVIGLVCGVFLGIFIAFFTEWMASARREHESQQ